MVGVVSQFPMVGASFMGAYRDARQNRLAEAAARAEMAAREADRRRQEEARQAFGRLTSPAPAIGFDTGVAQGAVSTYTPERQQQDLGAVFMGGMGGDLAAYREFTSPQRREPTEYEQSIYEVAAGRIAQGMEPQEAIGRAAMAVGRDPQEVARYVSAFEPEQPERTALQQRAFDAGLQPGTAEYQQFMLRGGQGYAPQRSSGMSELARALMAQNQPPIPIGATQSGFGLNSRYGGEYYDPSAEYRLSGVDSRGREQWEQIERAPATARVRGSELGEGYDPEAFYEPVIQGGETVGWERVEEGGENIHNQARLEQERRYGNIVLDDSMRALDVIYENPNALSVFVPAQRAFGRFVTPTPASRLDNLLRPIGSYISLGRLGEMRLAAETGGALGNVSNFEVERLEAAYGSIDPDGQMPEELAYNIARFNNLIYATVYGHDFDGDGIVDPIYVDDDPQETERRYNYALQNGPAGSPTEARARVTQGRNRRSNAQNIPPLPEGFVEF